MKENIKSYFHKFKAILISEALVGILSNFVIISGLFCFSLWGIDNLLTFFSIDLTTLPFLVKFYPVPLLGISLVFVFVVLTVLFCFGRLSFIIRKKKLTHLAEKIENRISFSGELVSCADFIENNYNHSKFLENRFFGWFESKIKGIGFKKLFQIKKYYFVSLIALILVVGSFFLPENNPSYSFKKLFKTDLPEQTNNIKELIEPIFFKLEYKDKVLYNEDFNIDIITNSEKVFFVVYLDNNLSTDVLNDRPYEVLNGKSIDKNAPKKLKKIHHTVKNIDTTFSFQIKFEKGGEKKETSKISVKMLRRPVLKDLFLFYYYPKYYQMVKTDKVVKDDGNINDFKNTRIVINSVFGSFIKSGYISIYHPSYDSLISDLLIYLSLNKNNNLKKENFEKVLPLIKKYYVKDGKVDYYGFTQQETELSNIVISFFNKFKEVFPIPQNEIENIIDLSLEKIKGENDLLDLVKILNNRIIFDGNKEIDYINFTLFSIQNSILYYNRNNNGNKLIEKRNLYVNNKTTLTSELVLKEPIYYIIKCIDTDDLENVVQVPYKVTILTDNLPKIQVYKPKEKVINISFEDSSKIIRTGFNVFLDMEDDYYLDYFVIHRSKTLFKEKNARNIDDKRQNINSKIPVKKELVVSLKDLILSSGDLVDFSFTVFDNIGQFSNSERFTLKFESMKDYLQRMESTAKNESERMKDILEKEKQIKLEVDSDFLKKKNKENQNNNAENEKKVKTLSDDRMKEVQKSYQELSKLKKSMKESGVDDKKIQEKLSEIMEMQKKLLDLMQNYDSSDRKTQEKIQKSEEKILQKYKKLLDLIKLLKGKEQISKMKETQKEVNKDIKDDKIGENTVQKMDQIKENIENLKKTLDESDFKNLKEEISKVKEKSNKLREKTNNLQKDLQKSNSNKNNKNSKKDSQDKAQNEKMNKSGEENLDSMNDMEKDMKDAISSLSGMDNYEMVLFLTNLSFELVEYSKYESERVALFESLGANLRNNTKTNELTDLIEEINFNLSFISSRKTEFDEKLEGVLSSKDVFLDAFEDVIKQYKSIEKDIASRGYGNLKVRHSKLYSSLNILTYMIIKLKNDITSNMQSSSSGENGEQGGYQNTEDIVQKQKMLNDAINQFKEQTGKGQKGKTGKDSEGEGGYSSEQIKYMEELAKMQEQIANELNERTKKAGNNTLGDLKNIVEEMKKTVKDLKEKKLDQQLVDRQEKILDKLLNSAKSMLQSKELDKKERESEQPDKNMVVEESDKEKQKFYEMLKKQEKGTQKNKKNMTEYQKKLVKDYYDRLKEYEK